MSDFYLVSIEYSYRNEMYSLDLQCYFPSVDLSFAKIIIIIKNTYPPRFFFSFYLSFDFFDFWNSTIFYSLVDYYFPNQAKL